VTPDRDHTDGLDTDEGVGGVTAGDFDLGGAEEAQERRVEGGDPVNGDARSVVAEEPMQAIDPDVARNTSEPIRVSDRGPGGGTPPGTPPPV
jgi:hypothetical protein